MLRTPLSSFHADHKGHMVDFAGWEMPLYYGSILDEHRQCRASGSIFDVSHMGRVKVTGRDARRFLERLCTRRISDMTAGQCRYSLVCNERGGVRDDVIVYRQDEDEFMVVVNASNREKLLGHFENVKAEGGGLNMKIDDQTLSTAMIALQGPKVMPLVSSLSSEIGALKRYRFTTIDLMIAKLIVSRTGYTGEDGVELILPASMVGMALSQLSGKVDMKASDAAIKPCGLGARDTLRIEAAMPLYGHELGEEIPATACGVDFAIALDKDQAEKGEPFVGQAALRALAANGGPARKLVGLEIDGKRPARQGMIVRSGGVEVGAVSSGCFGPTINRSIAMAFVDREKCAPGTSLEVDTGKGSKFAASVVPMPFYKLAK